ncbi:PREDICTED: UDP-glucuronosyltransferase 2B18-like [Wasmannia auropunctata]|uniref:UDP-glucuronosyltransferase 2B18-like n=1 Tax=Wasmannia auropunctata TaxID=64793 RepID=UPI0005EE427E|nr:PREDICTED: UDP-glucuronosyltransferase 2B18-like [Wasmannia auropunctata]XP_011694147.1 PREDICTED: UDP-glucuronosyltransferase 2B18-like [Wasmannia auropunctata]XP_011694149.1 PREDICTED: UDP-glucuronosyltransferase 2B18-like [Wasmannia auropunctata]XP_011694150.1 PREDICTED: UDP-glucuronosyltransferase 2B18-like [Wasmannia auropunctata]
MKPNTEITFWITWLLYVAIPIETAKILAIIAIPSYSHQIPYRPLWTTLSRRGHEIVLLTTDPINDPSLTNLTEINFEFNYKLIRKINFVKNVGAQTWLNSVRTQVWSMSREVAENIYKHPEVHQLYAPDSDRKFDVVIAETIKTPSLYALAHRFNAPLIGVSTFGLYNNNYYLLGAPVLSSHPSAWEMEDDTGFNLSLWQRIKNFVRQWYHIYCVLNHFYPEQQAIAEKYLGKNIPDISDMERNISFAFYNQQEAISFVRPRTSNVLAFGNFHISKTPATLPEDLKKFITDAPNGCIYVSLGTNVMISSLPEHVQNIFRDVFISLPYKILWKHDSELPNKPDNIYTAKWFPQQSILAHPNIRLFIYQGGLQSTEEAVYYTVPLLGLPVLADQYAQINKMVSLGVAKRLNLMDLSRESLNASIMEILSDKRYKKRMLKVKMLNEDKPYDVLEHVIWWIEFVIRHKGAPHLRTNIAHEPWYQRYDMDIIAILSIVIFVTLLCTLVIIYKLLKIISNFTKISVVKKKIN